jgi:saxitoxin biosynthesis operon SxtJ-like protein
MNKDVSFHENFQRPEDIALGSERGFGFVFAAFCAIVAAYMLWHTRLAFWAWIAAAVTFVALATLLPRVLRPLNIAWSKLGLLIHHIVSPVMLALMFFAVFTPIAAWMRMTKSRPLRLQFEPDARSYWIVRDPPGPGASSFRNQF